MQYFLHQYYIFVSQTSSTVLSLFELSFISIKLMVCSKRIICRIWFLSGYIKLTVNSLLFIELHQFLWLFWESQNHKNLTIIKYTFRIGNNLISYFKSIQNLQISEVNNHLFFFQFMKIVMVTFLSVLDLKDVTWQMFLLKQDLPEHLCSPLSFKQGLCCSIFSLLCFVL